MMRARDYAVILGEFGILALAGCCAHSSVGGTPPGGVQLAPLVSTIKSELETIDRERLARGQASLLELEAVELELTFDAKKSAEAEGGVEVWVIKAGTKATAEWNSGQKMVIKFKPVPVRTVTLPPNPSAFDKHKGEAR